MPENKPTYELITKKSRESVALLYERYGRRLAGYAIRQWKLDEDNSWELVYKTLYRVLETHADYKFSGEKKFSGFVFTIFINYLRNFYRDKKQLPVEIRGIDEQIGEMAEETDNSPSPAVVLLMQELDQLEDWERILLLMRGQDVPYQEIARLTGKPEDHLKVYYQRLRKKLADRLGDKIFQTGTTVPGKKQQE